MSLRTITYTALSFTLLCVSAHSNASSLQTQAPAQTNKTQQPPTLKDMATQLGWVTAKNQYNLCGGYYSELPIPYVSNKKAQSQKDNYNIYAQHSEWSFTGSSTFQGHVRVIQANQEMTADLAHVLRDPKTQQTNFINAFGNVHFIAPGFLAIANNGSYDTQQGLITLQNVSYRAAPNATRVEIKDPFTGNIEYHIYDLNANGEAQEAKKVQAHIYTFRDASYSTCAPINQSWRVKAHHLKLDYNTGTGSASHALMYVHNIPVLYFPYYSFPLDQRRKTGFLSPTYSYSTNSGMQVNIPFYWNMAPNYDMTFTPEWMSFRGVMLNDTLRYLNSDGGGMIKGSMLPNDSDFANTQEKAVTQYANQPLLATQLNDLESASDNRRSFAWYNNSHFNSHWNSSLNYNYASDDNYEEDFGTTNFFSATSNQLLQKLSLNYSNNYFYANSLLQQYQTLHPIDQSVIQDQYARLPELDFGVHSPLLPNNISPGVDGQVVNFTIKKTPGTVQRLVSGERAYLNPSASWNFGNSFSSLIPRFKEHLISYDLSNPSPDTPETPARAIPTFSLDSDLVFAREFKAFHSNMEQTLEPRVYYLLTPYVYQNDLPDFDTDLQPFSYANMFNDNRFNGPDRVGDANQVTLGLNSNFINRDSGATQGQLAIADIYYFRDRRVTTCYGSTCSTNATQTNQYHVSPIAVLGNYAFNPEWSANANWAWSPQLNQTASASAAFQYKASNNKLANLAFYHVNDQASGITNQSDHPTLNTAVQPSQDLEEVVLSAVWPLTNNWSTLGSFNRNWSQDQGTVVNQETDIYNTFTYGLQYDSCCWAARMIAYRTFNGFSQQNRATFNSGVYFQLSLKGLGNLGESGITGLLNTNITGYQDSFGGRAI